MFTRVVAGLLLAAGFGLSANPVSFQDTPKGYKVAGVQAIIAADFNGDGTPDVAVANGQNSISVLLGDSRRTFLPAHAYGVGAGINAGLAVGDFNGDGKQDLVTLNYSSAELEVLLGNGDGTFQPAVSYPVSAQPETVVAGDFNGDGKEDVAVSTFFNGTLSVMFGNGDGTFQAAKRFSPDGSPLGMAAGDFNGDGKTDLAVVNQTSISILLSNGDGTFRPGWHFKLPNFTPTASVTAGDVNLDGKLDLLVGGNYFSSGFLRVFTGKGDGTFHLAASFDSVDDCCSAVSIIDVSHDGKPDLLANGGKLFVALGDGNGSFQSPRFFPVCGTGVFASGKFGSDVQTDVAVGCGDTVGVVRGLGDGAFILPPQVPEKEPTSLAFADFNGDGRLDMAAVRNPDGFIDIFPGKGDGSFGRGGSYAVAANPVGQYPQFVTTGDFNNDGKPDLAVANNIGSNVGVLLGNGDGTFQAAQNYAVGSLPESAVVGDFNNDGHQDLAVANKGDGTITVLFGRGDGTFPTSQVVQAGNGPCALAVGDFNGDGKTDLLVLNNYSGSVSVLLGRGDGTFTVSNLQVGNSPNRIVTGDFNGDGKLDFAVTLPFNSSNPFGSVLVFQGHGDGTFGAPRHFATGPTPNGLVAADFNRDGAMDLAILADTQVWLLLGRGNGDFQAGPIFEAGGNSSESLVAGDLNGDGRPDLAVANYYSDSIWILINKPR